MFPMTYGPPTKPGGRRHNGRMTAPHEGAIPKTFHALEAKESLGELAQSGEADIEHGRRWFEWRASSEMLYRIHPPLVAPIAPGHRDLGDYLDDVPEVLGAHLMVLMQAGASSLGWFEGGECRSTKSFRRYVVRGKGRAQPTHLKSKGKSRYGSRLRLQNAEALLEETVERMQDWWDEFGPAERVLVSCPVRLWASVLEMEPAPPFVAADTPVTKIPKDLPKPTSELLDRTYRFCCYGRVELAP